jgi:hypothetical protein
MLTYESPLTMWTVAQNLSNSKVPEGTRETNPLNSEIQNDKQNIRFIIKLCFVILQANLLFLEIIEMFFIKSLFIIVTCQS